MAIAARASPVKTRRRFRLDLTTPTLLGPPLAWLGVFFLVPIAIVAAYSFDVYSLDSGPHGFTLTAWHHFLHSSIYLSLFWKSVKMSLIVSTLIGLAAVRRRAFGKVTLPLSLPGVFAAFMFVFIPAPGELVTPSLVGGRSGY